MTPRPAAQETQPELPIVFEAVLDTRAAETALSPAPAQPAPGTLLALPVIRSQPPRLSQHLRELEAIEASGVYSNYGPVNTRFEAELTRRFFAGTGACVTVCNATIGLMIAVRSVIGEDRSPTPTRPARRYALMPSFTFAATGQAAMWCGLTPLLCDMDPATWLPSAASEERLLREYAGQIAVVIPYATFGNNLDLARYDRLACEHDIPVVIDAAASLGSIDDRGRSFGTGFPWPVVFSMHATKQFSVGEGGVIYSADRARIAHLRSMGGFGFDQPRTASMLGLNAKMSEVTALTALLELREFDSAVGERQALLDAYARELGDDFPLQLQCGQRQVRSFQSVLLPRMLAAHRPEVIGRLRERGIGAGHYFSPHLAEQPLFAGGAINPGVPVTDDVAARVLSLPLLRGMLLAEVTHVVTALREVCDELRDGPASVAS